MLHFTPISMFGKNKTKIVSGQENVSVQLARLAFPTLMAKKLFCHKAVLQNHLRKRHKGDNYMDMGYFYCPKNYLGKVCPYVPCSYVNGTYGQ
jgi:hypothetical protein